MASISVKLHRQFAARGARNPPGRPLRDMGSLLAERERRRFAARAPGSSRAVSILLQLSLWLACFFSGALAFAYLSRRW
jgi:hypothetical protein